MKCNNIYCYWSMFDTCCHEDKEVHFNEELQEPNKLDCPSALRSDFESILRGLYEWNFTHLISSGSTIKEAQLMLDDKNFSELLGLYNMLSGVSKI